MSGTPEMLHSPKNEDYLEDFDGWDCGSEQAVDSSHDSDADDEVDYHKLNLPDNLHSHRGIAELEAGFGGHWQSDIRYICPEIVPDDTIHQHSNVIDWYNHHISTAALNDSHRVYQNISMVATQPQARPMLASDQGINSAEEPWGESQIRSYATDVMGLNMNEKLLNLLIRIHDLFNRLEEGKILKRSYGQGGSILRFTSFEVLPDMVDSFVEEMEVTVSAHRYVFNDSTSCNLARSIYNLFRCCGISPVKGSKVSPRNHNEAPSMMHYSKFTFCETKMKKKQDRLRGGPDGRALNRRGPSLPPD